MKKNCFKVFICLLFITSILFNSCSSYLFRDCFKDKSSKYLISKKINQFKKTGLLDNIDSLIENRTVLTDDNISNQDILFFINNTDYCLDAILSEENGEKEFIALNAIYGEDSIGNVYDTMKDFSSELADEYEQSLVSIYNDSIDDIDNQISDISSLRDINLSFDNDLNTSSRAVDLSKSYSWESVLGYVAASAGTIAGLLMCRYGGFWTRIAGYVVGGVGIATMTTFFVIWQKSAEWIIFQNVCKSTYRFINNCKTIYLDCSDKEKALKFLEDVSNDLLEVSKNNPKISSDCELLLKYLDGKYINAENAYMEIKELLQYFATSKDFVNKSITVLATTTTVYLTAQCTGFIGTVKEWCSLLKQLLPDWLIISKNGFELSFTF